MAMFESEGYCPSNSLFHVLLAMQDQDKAVEIQKLFGDRTGYMVYAEHEVAFVGETNSLALAIKNDPDFGLRLANLLAQLIPVCEYTKSGRKILIHDVVSPYQAAGEDLLESEDGFSFYENGMGNIHKPIKRKGSKYILETTNDEYDGDLITKALMHVDVIDKDFLKAFCPRPRFLFVVDDNDGEGQIDIRIARIS